MISCGPWLSLLPVSVDLRLANTHMLKPTVEAENRLTKGINSIVSSLPNFSQVPLIANRTLNASLQEWQRLQSLVQERAAADIALFQKTVQNFSNEMSSIASSSSFSLTNYKAYVDLYVNYRTELMRLIYQVANDVFTLLTVELPKSLHRVMLAARKQVLLTH